MTNIIRIIAILIIIRPCAATERKCQCHLNIAAASLTTALAAPACRCGEGCWRPACTFNKGLERERAEALADLWAAVAEDRQTEPPRPGDTARCLWRATRVQCRRISGPTPTGV